MSVLKVSHTSVGDHLKLVEAKFRRWNKAEFQPEFDRRIKELKTTQRDVPFNGRALLTIQLYRDLLARQCRKRIAIYADVARDTGNPIMLLEACLIGFEKRIRISLGAAIASLRVRTLRAARAVGLASSYLPNEARYVQLESDILDVVKSELGVLAAEGNLSHCINESALAAPADQRTSVGNNHTSTSVTSEVSQPGLQFIVQEVVDQRTRQTAAQGKLAEQIGHKPATETEDVVPRVDRKKRLSTQIDSPIAARRLEAYLESKLIRQTEFGIQVGTTDRTIRKFRETGRIGRDLFDKFAAAMGCTREELMKE